MCVTGTNKFPLNEAHFTLTGLLTGINIGGQLQPFLTEMWQVASFRWSQEEHNEKNCRAAPRPVGQRLFFSS